MEDTFPIDDELFGEVSMEEMVDGVQAAEEAQIYQDQDSMPERSEEDA